MRATRASLGRGVPHQRAAGNGQFVVGVMPEHFGFPHGSKLWLPLRLNPSAAPWGSGQRVNGVARLRAGVSYAQASAELATIARRIEAEHSQSNKGVRAVLQPFIRATIPTRVYALLYAMFGAVGLVFLVACTNVANLLLARATHRAKEVAIRVALGASRLAIARQFLVEALVLSIVSSILGAVIAQAGIVVFRRATVGQMPFWAEARFDAQVFVFIALAALLASVVSGVLPTITAARSDITDVLKDQSMGSSSLRGWRLSRGLVVFELALSAALLVVAALTTKSVLNLPRRRARVPHSRRHDRPDHTNGPRYRTAQSNLRAGGIGGCDVAGRNDAVTQHRSSRQRMGRRCRRRGRPHVSACLIAFQVFSTARSVARFLHDLRRRHLARSRDRRGGPRRHAPGGSRQSAFCRSTIPECRPDRPPHHSLAPEDSIARWVTHHRRHSEPVRLRPRLDQSQHSAASAEVLTAFRQESQGSASIAIFAPTAIPLLLHSRCAPAGRVARSRSPRLRADVDERRGRRVAVGTSASLAVCSSSSASPRSPWRRSVYTRFSRSRGHEARRRQQTARCGRSTATRRAHRSKQIELTNARSSSRPPSGECRGTPTGSVTDRADRRRTFRNDADDHPARSSLLEQRWRSGRVIDRRSD